MHLSHENSLVSLDHFLNGIKDKPSSWRLISIEFQSSETLNSSLFENICRKSLQTCFDQTECHIFWVKPEFILIFFQGRALPIEKCVEEFFKATEFKGFGRFFDILDLSVHWSNMMQLRERLTKAKIKTVSGSAPSEEPLIEPQTGFKIELTREKVIQMMPVREARTKPLILLVEDDPFTQQLVRLSLKDKYDVISAETARQALAFYQRHLPDLVFQDIQLPDGNGINLLEEMKRADPNAYVVMLSSHTQKEKILECQSLGAQSFIAKPFTRQRLVDATEKFMSKRAGLSGTKEGRHGT